MKAAMVHFFAFLESFAHPSVRLLPEDQRYHCYLIPALLVLCLLDAVSFGLFAHFYLDSTSLSLFSFGSALIFSTLLLLSRRPIRARPLVLSYFSMMSGFFVVSVVFFEQDDLIILLGRFSVYIMVAVLLSGRRVLQALVGCVVFVGAGLLVIQNLGKFPAHGGMSDVMHMDALLVSTALSSLLIFALMAVYSQTCDFALSHMEKQKRWHDSNRLTKEFGNLAGYMNSVLQGPIEDVLSALPTIRHVYGDTEAGLATVKRASEAVYGIARSFGVLAQDQKEAYMVRINLDELVRYAHIVCQNNFNGLGVVMDYQAEETPVEFMGASGRWLLLLVSLMQFMAEQIHEAGGKRLLLKRHKRDGAWELVLLADGVAPFEFPYDLRQKLKEESTQELLKQTSGRAFLYLLDRWGLKLGSFQSA